MSALLSFPGWMLVIAVVFLFLATFTVVMFIAISYAIDRDRHREDDVWR